MELAVVLAIWSTWRTRPSKSLRTDVGLAVTRVDRFFFTTRWKKVKSTFSRLPMKRDNGDEPFAIREDSACCTSLHIFSFLHSQREGRFTRHDQHPFVDSDGREDLPEVRHLQIITRARVRALGTEEHAVLANGALDELSSSSSDVIKLLRQRQSRVVQGLLPSQHRWNRRGQRQYNDSPSHHFTSSSVDRTTVCQDAKLGDYFVEQERVNEGRTRWQFDLLVCRRRQFDADSNTVLHDTCSVNSFSSEGGC